MTPDNGYMAWCWADDPALRVRLKATLDSLSDGYIQARGLYLFHPEKYDELVSLRREFAQRDDAGVTIVVYEEIA